MYNRQRVLIDLRDTHQARLDELVEKRARLGYSADPALNMEIDDIERQMSELSASIQALNTVQDLIRDQQNKRPNPHAPIQEDRRDLEARLQVMLATVQATVSEVSSVKRYVTDEINKVYSLVKIGLAVIVFFEIVRTMLLWYLQSP